MKKLVLAAALALLAAPALAHTGHGASSGLLHGLLHPITGADHLLAMLAVGLWSGLALTRRVWAGAATFMAAMVLGAVLGWSGMAIPHVETAIAASVAVFGLLAIFARAGQSRQLTAASLVAIGGFAACHGHAHAAEATGQAVAYLAGFLVTTGALHLAGIAMARSVAASRIAQRVAGAALVASGAWLVSG